jgi:hypothetical protein
LLLPLVKVVDCNCEIVWFNKTDRQIQHYLVDMARRMVNG